MLTSYSQENSVSFPAPPYPLQDFKTLYKCCIIIIIFIIPPYGSMGVFSFLFVFLFFFGLYGYGFLSSGKRGVEFCVCVRLLSQQVFSHFGELWLAGTHGGALLPGCTHRHIGATWQLPVRLGGAVGIGGGGIA